MLKDVVIAGKTNVKMDVSDETILDQIAIRVIRQDMPEFLLPVKMMHVNGETEIRYEIGEGIRLSYYPENMSKNEFLMLMEHMIRPFQICNDYFLDYHKFYLDKEYIMIGKDGTHLRYLYRFDETYQLTDEQILEFFREFLLDINLSDDKQFIFQLYRKSKEKTTTLTAFFESIIQENLSVKESFDREELPTKEVMRESLEGRIENSAYEVKKAEEIKEEVSEKEKFPELAFGKNDEKIELMDKLFGEEEKSENKRSVGKKQKKQKKIEHTEEKEHKSFFSGIFGNKKNDKKDNEIQEHKVREENPFLDMVSAEERTNEARKVFVEEDQTEFDQAENGGVNQADLCLVLEEDRGFLCPKYFEISLQKEYATLGRFDKMGRPQADYNFDASLSFISRVHCRFERKQGQIVMIDLGSKNGTLVNDVLLSVNMPFPIQRGDRIIFSKNNRITYRVC